MDEKNSYVLISEDGENEPQNVHFVGQEQIRLNELNEEQILGEDNGGETIEAKNSQRTCKSLFRQIEGKLSIFLAGMISVNVYSLNKHVGHMPVGQFSSSVFIFSFLFLLPVFFFREKKVSFYGKAKFIITRAFFGAIGGIFKYWAAEEMDYGDSVSLGSLAPIFAALFSRVLWKEKLSIFTLVALFIGVTGIVLVAKPTFLFGIFMESQENEFDPVMKLVPIAGSIIYGFAFSCMRKVGTEVSPILVSLLVSIIVVPDGIIFQLIYEEEFVLPGCFTDRIVICVAGFGLCVALLLLNRGLALEKSGPGVLIRNLDIVVAYGIQVVFFNSIPDVMSICGAVLVISSAVIVTANKLFFEKCCKYEF